MHAAVSVTMIFQFERYWPGQWISDTCMFRGRTEGAIWEDLRPEGVGRKIL